MGIGEVVAVWREEGCLEMGALGMGYGQGLSVKPGGEKKVVCRSDSV